ncbi:uncharacterized protein LOC118433093 [Folsomia candida]|uniref:Uncharacterized protein n=1 Tax=Folsomia candida TaxID=158441 RepID=A0A226D2F3_FOLCA|nr:uncharacterized protein LOC118433093 [Folsomia candida]OXA39054.1 hypothetical protein Fcan01_26085 [Folsomia candida]
METIYILSRKVNVDDKVGHINGRDYGGVHYSFSFMCPSNDIRLHGLTFFGPQYAVPFSGGSVSYFAQIRMDKEVPRARTWSDYLWGIWTGTVPHTSILDGFYMSESVWKVTVKEEDAKNPITIMLGKRVELPAGEWIHIRFQLDGPPTERLKKEDKNRTTIWHPESKLMFHTLIGSGQLKDIHFSVI